MTVEELIEALKTMPPAATLVFDCNSEYRFDRVYVRMVGDMVVIDTDKE